MKLNIKQVLVIIIIFTQNSNCFETMTSIQNHETIAKNVELNDDRVNNSCIAKLNNYSSLNNSCKNKYYSSVLTLGNELYRNKSEM